MNANLGNAGARIESGAAPQRAIDLPALVSISWSVAGGLLAGGATVATMVLTGHLSGHMLITASAVFYVIGALLGLAHGVMLGIFGRPEGVTPRQAFGAMLHGLIFLVPALFLGWLIAGWVAALPIVLLGRHILAGGITLVAWMVMVAVITVAATAGLRALKLAWRRWPDRVLGTTLVATTFASLAVMFIIEQPTVWFWNLQLTGFGAAVFAYALTFWFYGPIITASLVLLRRIAPMLPASRLHVPENWREWTKAGGIVFAAGLLIVSLAVPFYAGVLGLPTDAQRFGVWQGILVAAGHAMTDEVLLRLFLFTGVFVVAARYLKRSSRAVALAIAIATVGDLLLRWPDMAAMGLPGMTALLSYIVARVAVPAILFGYLFWRRGLGTAVAVHTAANVALGLLLI